MQWWRSWSRRRRAAAATRMAACPTWAAWAAWTCNTAAAATERGAPAPLFIYTRPHADTRRGGRRGPGRSRAAQAAPGGLRRGLAAKRLRSRRRPRDRAVRSADPRYRPAEEIRA